MSKNIHKNTSDTVLVCGRGLMTWYRPHAFHLYVYNCYLYVLCGHVQKKNLRNRNSEMLNIRLFHFKKKALYFLKLVLQMYPDQL